jgi:hypothetical protein
MLIYCIEMNYKRYPLLVTNSAGSGDGSGRAGVRRVLATGGDGNRKGDVERPRRSLERAYVVGWLAVAGHGNRGWAGLRCAEGVAIVGQRTCFYRD